MKYLKCVLMGSHGSGKTNLLLRYADNTFNDAFMRSMGVDFKIKTVPFRDGQVKLQLWDTMGKISESPMMYRERILSAHKDKVFLLTIDLNQSDEQIREDLEKYSRFFSREDVVVVGTKSDLVENSKRNRFKALVQASSIQKNMGIFEVSAKDGMNVEALFNTLVEEKLKKDSSFKYKQEPDQASTSGSSANQDLNRISELEQEISRLRGDLSEAQQNAQASVSLYHNSLRRQYCSKIGGCINDLEAYGNKIGSEPVRRCVVELRQKIQGFLNSPELTLNQFKNNFSAVLQRYEKNDFAKKRDFTLKHITANILIALTGVGILFQLVNKCSSGRFGFFFGSTTREKLAEEIHNQVEANLTA